MIRRAESKDIMPILAIGKELHQKIGGLPPIDEQGSRMLLARALCDKQKLLLVGERNGAINGFFFGMVDELFFSKAKYATDVIWTSTDPVNSVLMLRRFLVWAKEKNVHHIELGISSGVEPERTEALYQKLGFTRVGAHFIKRPL